MNVQPLTGLPCGNTDISMPPLFPGAMLPATKFSTAQTLTEINRLAQMAIPEFDLSVSVSSSPS